MSIFDRSDCNNLHTIKKGSDSQSADSNTDSSGGGARLKTAQALQTRAIPGWAEPHPLSRDQFIAQMPAKLKGRTIPICRLERPDEADGRRL